jgi:hypothetical protein
MIAVGILAILMPWILEALRFAELGPVEGGINTIKLRRDADRGYVTKDSLFSARYGLPPTDCKGLPIASLYKLFVLNQAVMSPPAIPPPSQLTLKLMISARVVDLPLRHPIFARGLVAGIARIRFLFLYFGFGKEAIVIIGRGHGGRCCCHRRSLE